MSLRFTLPFIIFIFIFILLWRGLSLHPNEVPSPLIDKPAPQFQLPELNNKRMLTNKDLLGHVTLVNVWATWCDACALEHDFLLKLAKNEHIIFYGIDYKDDESLAKKWLTTKGNPYQVVAFDKSGKVAIDWGVYGTPETFIVDKKGIIRYKQIGPITAFEWENHLAALIDTLQKEAA